MKKSSRTLFVFGIYFGSMGIILMTVPNLLMRMLTLPATHEVWIRVLGFLITILAYYDIHASLADLTIFVKWSILPRVACIFVLGAFILMGWVAYPLILIGIIDLASAIWTKLVLMKEEGANKAGL